MDRIERLRLRIIGISCATCIIPIHKQFEKTNGVKFVGSNYVTDFLLIDYDFEIITKSEIMQIIKKVGYDTVAMF